MGKKRSEYPNAHRAILKAADVIDTYRGPAVFLETYGRVRREIGLLFATALCEFEVCNGGFHQFFDNSAGVLAPAAVEGFVAIGQPQIAALVRKAMDKLGSPYPRDWVARNDARGLLSKGAFDELERQFYELICTGGGGISPASERYAVSNKIFSKKK
jgi:hypothetical protein